MSGWAEYDIREQLKQTWNVPVLVDNDVNLLTLAEHRRNWTQYDHILYIKVGTGVGSGMVINGAIHRGAQGAAGDIGHAQMNGYGDPQCRCGNFGCLEALVGGWALARDISTICDIKLHDARAVAKEVRHGNSQVVARLRAAGRIVGEAASSATSLVNPDIITLGGTLGTIGDHLLAGVREAVYQRAPALATRQLKIVPTQLRSHAAIIGAAYLARDHILAPEMVDGRIPATD
jgi:glucokinase